MIQRIQTIYLLLVVILGCIQCFYPVAGFIDQTTLHLYDVEFSGVYQQTVETAESSMSVWGLSVISAVIPAIALATVFLYRKRIVQARFCVFNIILMVGYYAMLFLYLWLGKEKLQADWFLNITSAFPLVNIVLTFMAIRNILKDEALVRAADRIR